MASESLQEEHQPQTIRVLTFNILSTDHASWERRLQVARTGLQALRPDILALQETRPGHAQDQVTDLLGPDYHVVENPVRSGEMVGAALVSRWPFVNVREVDLSVAPRVPSAAAVVRGDAARIGPADRLHHDQKWHSRTHSGYCWLPAHPQPENCRNLGQRSFRGRG
jgi:exonuclease III